MSSIKSHPLTIGLTVLKKSDDLAILGVTFDSMMIFEKHLRSVSRAASQILCILTWPSHRRGMGVEWPWTAIPRPCTP